MPKYCIYTPPGKNKNAENEAHLGLWWDKAVNQERERETEGCCMEPVQAEHFKIYMQWVGGDYIQETQINLPERMEEGIHRCNSAGRS